MRRLTALLKSAKGLFKLSLPTRFILAITLAYVLLVGIFIFLVVQRELKLFERQVIQHAMSYANGVASAAAGHIILYDLLTETYDLASLKEIIDNTHTEKNIAYVIIQDRNNKVLASSHPDYTSGVLSDQVSQRANQAIAPVVQRLGKLLDIAVPVTEDGQKQGSVRVGYSLAETMGLLSAFRRAGIRIVIISVFLGGLMAALLTWQVTRALGKLIKATLGTAKGDLDQRVDIRTGDELEELGRCFNMMAESLKASRQKLESYNKELQAEVERRTFALKASEEKYRGLVEGADDGIFLMACKKAELLEANQMAMLMSGRTLEELRGMTLYDLVSPAGKYQRAEERH